MIVGERLREIRRDEQYISRVENGHTVPSIETLEKWAHAMEVPLYQIFYDTENGQPEELKLPKRAATKLSGKDAAMISRLTRLVSDMDDRDKRLLVGMAQKLAAR